jgi:hypothetical protein
MYASFLGISSHLKIYAQSHPFGVGSRFGTAFLPVGFANLYKAKEAGGTLLNNSSFPKAGYFCFIITELGQHLRTVLTQFGRRLPDF